MTHDSHVLNTRAHTKERIGQLLTFAGKESEHADAFGPGDIGAVAKLKETVAGDWLAARDEPIDMPAIKLPAPVMAFAIEAAVKGDEDKVFASLRRLQEEDPTIDLHRDAQTGDQIVAGLSQMHVEVIVERLKSRFGVERRAAPAARALPGDDPRHGQGPRAPQEAERRSRPVRRLPHRDRAGPAAERAGLRQQHQGRRDPDLASSRRSRRASRRRWSTGRSPASRSRTCRSRSTTAATTPSTVRRWRSSWPARRP